jgi:dTDP-4-dehydrorhamnose reductase
MNAKPIVITGSGGMLGSDLALYLSEKELVLPFKHSDLDITNPDMVRRMLEKIRPAVLINAAAYTNVDGAERERDKALLLNVEGPEILAELCAVYGTKLVHFSTDYVFNGQSTRPWEETDTPCPPQPNYYAETKLAGEVAVQTIANHLILRVQWLFGEKKDRFTILKGKESFTPFRDQFGAPQWTREIARIIHELLKRDARGLFHFAYDDYASWAEVYEFVKEELALPVKLSPVQSEDVLLPAKRPTFGVLSNKKLLSFLGWKKMGSWKDPLREFLILKTQTALSKRESTQPLPVSQFQ